MTVHQFQFPNNRHRANPGRFKIRPEWLRGIPAHRRKTTGHPIRQSLPIARTTGPLATIQGRRILVLADVENIRYSARDLGFTTSFHTIERKLEEISHTSSLHAFFSRPAGDTQLPQYSSAHGWTPHTRDIEIVSTSEGPRKYANADNLLTFWAGLLVCQSTVDVVLILSGDGELVTEIAKPLSTLPRKCDVVTMSLAGSTAQRLDARLNGHILANVEIGLDCLQPIPAS